MCKEHSLIYFMQYCINSQVWTLSPYHVLCEGLRVKDVAMAEGQGRSDQA